MVWNQIFHCHYKRHATILKMICVPIYSILLGWAFYFLDDHPEQPVTTCQGSYWKCVMHRQTFLFHFFFSGETSKIKKIHYISHISSVLNFPSKMFWLVKLTQSVVKSVFWSCPIPYPSSRGHILRFVMSLTREDACCSLKSHLKTISPFAVIFKCCNRQMLFMLKCQQYTLTKAKKVKFHVTIPLRCYLWYF